jgi:RNA polymerase sigma-70 factor (ECF subfamily)
MNDTDNDLLRRCRGGSDEAWTELVRRYSRKVFAIAYRFCGRVEESEDLAQEIFVKVYQRLDRYQSTDGSFSAWLSAVARNHAIDHYRRGREERLHQIDAPIDLERFATKGAGQQKRLEQQERVEFVRRGIRALPRDLREPLILCDLQGLPYETIAGELSLPLGTVKSRINRGRQELARRLLRRRRDYGGSA